MPPEYENQSVTVESFGVRDDKGREVGARVRTWEWTTSEGARAFYMHTWAVRGGDTFGAIKPSRSFASAVERNTAVTDYLNSARKRANKQWG